MRARDSSWLSSEETVGDMNLGSQQHGPVSGWPGIGGPWAATAYRPRASNYPLPPGDSSTPGGRRAAEFRTPLRLTQLPQLGQKIDDLEIFCGS